MARQAHHHFIPSSYLKGFTEGGEDTSQFWCVPINNDKPFLTKPKDACSKRDYYTVEGKDSLVVEKFYATEVEPRINKALRQIDESKKLPSGDDWRHLFLLATTLYLRVPSQRSSIEDLMKQAREVADGIASDIPISNMYDFDYTKSDLIEIEVRQIRKIFDLLKNKHYRLLNASNSAFDFVTSDRPFQLIHPSDNDRNFFYGLNTPGIQICIPINRNIMLIGVNEPFREDTLSADDKMVGIMNKILIEGADRFFYSSKSEIPIIDDENNVLKHTISPNEAS